MSWSDPSVVGFAVVVIAPLSLWAAAIVDAVRGRFESGGEKALWVALVVLVPVVGFVVYLWAGRKRKLDRGR